MIKFEVSEKKENEPQMTAIYFGSENTNPSIVQGTRFKVDINRKSYQIELVDGSGIIYYASGQK